MAEGELEDKSRNGDLEKVGVEGRLPTITTKDHVAQDPNGRAKMFMWMVINTLATVAIVSLLQHHRIAACAFSYCFETCPPLRIGQPP